MTKQVGHWVSGVKNFTCLQNHKGELAAGPQTGEHPGQAERQALCLQGIALDLCWDQFSALTVEAILVKRRVLTLALVIPCGKEQRAGFPHSRAAL